MQTNYPGQQNQGAMPPQGGYAPPSQGYTPPSQGTGTAGMPGQQIVGSLADSKSKMLAMALWLFTGGLGGHMFYLGYKQDGIIRAALAGFYFITAIVGGNTPLAVNPFLWAISLAGGIAMCINIVLVLRDAWKLWRNPVDAKGCPLR